MNMGKHREKCPREVVDCKYEFAGCSARVIRKSMDAHLEVAAHAHLSLMVAAYSDMSICSQVQLEEKDAKISELTATVEELRQELLLLTATANVL